MEGLPSARFPRDSSFPRTRESRFAFRQISLDTRFRGNDGTSRWLLVFGFFVLWIIPRTYFKGQREVRSFYHSIPSRALWWDEISR